MLVVKKNSKQSTTIEVHIKAPPQRRLACSLQTSHILIIFASIISDLIISASILSMHDLPNFHHLISPKNNKLQQLIILLIKVTFVQHIHTCYISHGLVSWILTLMFRSRQSGIIGDILQTKSYVQSLKVTCAEEVVTGLGSSILNNKFVFYITPFLTGGFNIQISSVSAKLSYRVYQLES